MQIVNDVRDLVGKTPMLKLYGVDSKDNAEIYAKLELFNPGGSVKDRMGLALLRDAEESGRLKKGGAIVEATAGNAGIGIALAALNKGYRVIFTIPEKFSIEKQQIIRAFGAEIIHTPLELGMEGAIERQQALLGEIPDAISLGQFINPANPKIHYETTGPEIYQAMGGKIDYFVAGAGSGGTFSGVARYLKERIPALKTVMADPEGSIMGGGEEEHEYAIEGIGNSFMPETMDMSLVDQVIKVGDADAYAEVKRLAGEEGLLVGSSSGAAVFAARQLIRQKREDFRMLRAPARIVVVLPDRGDRYFSKNIFA